VRVPVLSAAPALQEHEVAPDLIEQVINLAALKSSDVGEEFGDQCSGDSALSREWP
jgi:hypothetical protein